MIYFLKICIFYLISCCVLEPGFCIAKLEESIPVHTEIRQSKPCLSRGWRANNNFSGDFLGANDHPDEYQGLTREELIRMAISNREILRRYRRRNSIAQERCNNQPRKDTRDWGTYWKDQAIASALLFGAVSIITVTMAGVWFVGRLVVGGLFKGKKDSA